jgi:hypothetical protein
MTLLFKLVYLKIATVIPLIIYKPQFFSITSILHRSFSVFMFLALVTPLIAILFFLFISLSVLKFMLLTSCVILVFHTTYSLYAIYSFKPVFFLIFLLLVFSPVIVVILTIMLFIFYIWFTL